MHSLVDSIDIYCDQCGAPFEAEIWLIVDVQERPDLLARVREETLHTAVCPACGGINHFLAPLLVFLPSQWPHLLFFPLPKTPLEEAQVQAEELLDYLLSSMDDDWDPAWLEGLTIVPELWQASSVMSEEGLPAFLQSIGRNFFQSYQQSNDDRDLANAIHFWQGAVDQASPEDPTRPGYLNDLGNGLMEWYQRHGQAQYLTQAIRCWEEAVETSPADSPHRFGFLMSLGMGISERYELTGSELDLDRSIDLYRQALTGPVENVAERAAWLNNLGTGLHARYRRNHSKEDLNEAIQVLLTAADLIPADSPHRASILTNLGDCLRERYLITRALDDLEQAIVLLQEAVRSTPPSSPDGPIRWMNLGAALHECWEATGDGDRLEEALTYWEQALQHMPPNAPARVDLLSNLGIGSLARYETTGHHEALHQAIDFLQQALDLTSPSSPHRPILLSNLGVAYHKAYQHTGQMQDLLNAIEYASEAITSSSAENPLLPIALNNLANAWQDRYVREHHLPYLARAIGYWRRAATEGDPHSVYRSMVLNNLGAGLRTYFQVTDDVDALDEAIRAFRDAIGHTLPEARDRAMFLNNLGVGLQDRFAHDQDAQNVHLLDEAIQAWRTAVEITPENDILLPSRLNNLASGLMARFRTNHQPEDWQEAIQYYEDALDIWRKHGVVFPLERRAAAINLGDLYYQQQDWLKAREAYAQAAEAANQLHLGVIRQESAQRLAREHATLYARLVHTCLELGDKTAAIDFILAAKGRALADALASRPLDLTALPEDLRQQVTSVMDIANHVHSLEVQLLQETDVQQVQSLLHILQARRQEEQEAWAHIRRRHPTFFRIQTGDSLTCDQAQALAHSHNTILISYYRHAKGWVAAIFHPHVSSPQLISLTLDDDQLIQLAEDARRLLAHRAGRALYRLQQLRQAIIDPLLPHLPPPSATQRLTLSPFGILHHLPMAALFQIQPEEKFSYLVSITPNLAAFQHMAQRARNRLRRDHLCIILYTPTDENAQVPPLAHAREEAEAIAKTFPQITRLDQATLPDLFQAASHAHVLHFITHGRFHGDPYQAGVLLADGWLRVQDILYQLRLPQAALVTLGACETGVPQVQPGDELASLSLAFLYAGAPAVVASLWPVGDASTAALFQAFYRHYRTGLSVVESLQAAQAEIRQRYPHPYHWATFQPTCAFS